MFDEAFQRQLSPRAWASDVLARVKAGEPVSRRVIDLALQFTGDLPLFYEGRRHVLEDKTTRSQRTAGG